MIMCSVIRWSDNGVAHVIARNMDWLEDTKSNLWILPQEIRRYGLAGKNSLKWTSKFGSVIAAAYDVSSTDGINEKGLVCRALWLADLDLINKAFLEYGIYF